MKHLLPGFKPVYESALSDLVFWGVSPGSASKSRLPKILILEPTRELVDQVEQQLQLFTKYFPDPVEVRVLTNQKALKTNTDLDILCGTPAKVMEFVKKHQPDLLNDVQFLVLDEADAMMRDKHSTDQIFYLWQSCRARGRLQVLFSSATMNDIDTKKMVDKLCRFPVVVDLKGGMSVPDNLKHVIIDVEGLVDTTSTDPIPLDGVHETKPETEDERVSRNIKLHKSQLVVKVIDTLNMDRAMIFCRTRLDCDNLSKYLTTLSHGKGPAAIYSNTVFHRGLSLDAQQKSLDDFREGICRFFIATDAAARGLDVAGLPFVINMTLPDKPEECIHRIGRTGRAERLGLAISLVAKHPEKVWYHTCQKAKQAKCRRTQLKHQGGCCVWFDEPDCLSQLEHLLGTELPHVTVDALCEWRSDAFGLKQKEAESLQSVLGLASEWVASMAPAVLQLARLEAELQQDHYGWADFKLSP
jgi:ATP-dependent RNA helicase DDX1